LFTELKKEGTKKLEEETPGMSVLDTNPRHDTFLDNRALPSIQEVDSEQKK
jgi:hypothetical protein